MQLPFSNDDSLSISGIMVVGGLQRNPLAMQAEAAMRDFVQNGMYCNCQILSIIAQ